MPQLHNSILTPFVEKLKARGDLDRADCIEILALPYRVSSLRRHEFIVREDQIARECCILLSGIAMRHKVAGNGLRQIFSIHMRGDAVDLHNSLLGRADHNLEMLSSGEGAFVPIDAVRALTMSHPRVAQAMWCETLVDASIFREWTLNVGRRDARSRMAHMLCEFAIRLELVGLGETTGYELPMTQEEVGDALALTSIHVSRTLKALEAENLVSRTRRSIKIIDWHRLAKIGDFDSGYLHLPENSERIPIAR